MDRAAGGSEVSGGGADTGVADATPTPLRDSKALPYLLVGAALLIVQLPTAMWVIGIILPLFASLWLFRTKRMSFLLATLAILALIPLRLYAYMSIVEGSHAIPPRYQSPGHIVRKNPVVLLFGVSDIHYIEHVVRRKFLSVAHGEETAIDPFSGRPLLEIDGIKYSVGPDWKDDQLTITYDPTNGTFSEGDIRLGAWIKSDQ